MIARPDADDSPHYVVVDAEPPPEPDPVVRGGALKWVAIVTVIAVPGAWITAEVLGLGPFLGATLIWLLVAAAGALYHRGVLRGVEKVKKELADDRRIEGTGGQGPGDIHPGSGDPTDSGGSDIGLAPGPGGLGHGTGDLPPPDAGRNGSR